MPTLRSRTIKFAKSLSKDDWTRRAPFEEPSC